MDEMKNYHTEICAYCKNEVTVMWDTEHDGGQKIIDTIAPITRIEIAAL